MTNEQAIKYLAANMVALTRLIKGEVPKGPASTPGQQADVIQRDCLKIYTEFGGELAAE